MWMIQIYEEVIHFQNNLVSNIFNMKGGIRLLMLDFLAQIIKHGVSVYWAPKSVFFLNELHTLNLYSSEELQTLIF